jgi:peptide/nickel transport system ATP-binding protein
VTASAVAEQRQPQPSGDPLVSVKGLTKHFPITSGVVFNREVGSVKAVQDVSFDIYPGETVGLVGESGCGKTTTGRLLTRLLEPTAGEIWFDGRDIANVRGRALRPLRREMQIMFQDPYSSLNPRKTVGQIIAAPFEIHSTTRDVRREVRDLMERVGLNPEHYNRYPHEFSGGQRQRIGIARALALRPKLIVCDEPVSALDVSIQAQILNLLQSLQEDLGLTYLFISHDLGVVRHLSDRVVVMYLGHVVEVADADNLYDDPKHPYTAALLSAVPKGHAVEEAEDRIVLRGDVPSPANPPTGCVFHPRCPKARVVSGSDERVPENCQNEMPPLGEVARNHLAACWYPLEQGESLQQAAHR